MKIGCCINMFGNTEDHIGRKYLNILKDSGLDYVEIPLTQVMELSDDDFADFQKELKACGVPCETCNNAFPASLRLTGLDVDYDAIKNYLDRAFSRAHTMGASVVVFGSSGAKNVPNGFSHKTAFKQIVDAGKIISDYAEKYDLMIAIEPICRREANIIKTLEEASLLQNEINSDRIKLLCDYYHFVVEKGRFSAFEKYGDEIIHTHIADPAKRTIPKRLPSEMLEFIKVVSTMKHEPRISIEAYSDSPELDLIKGVETIRNAIN